MTLPSEYIIASWIVPPAIVALVRVTSDNSTPLASILPLNVPSYMFSGLAKITRYGVIPSSGDPGLRRTVKFSLLRICKSVYVDIVAFQIHQSISFSIIYLYMVIAAVHYI